MFDVPRFDNAYGQMTSPICDCSAGGVHEAQVIGSAAPGLMTLTCATINARRIHVPAPDIDLEKRWALRNLMICTRRSAELPSYTQQLIQEIMAR